MLDILLTWAYNSIRCRLQVPSWQSNGELAMLFRRVVFGFVGVCMVLATLLAFSP